MRQCSIERVASVAGQYNFLDARRKCIYMGAEASAPTVEAARSDAPPCPGAAAAAGHRRHACAVPASWGSLARPSASWEPVDRPPTRRQEGFAVAGFQKGRRPTSGRPSARCLAGHAHPGQCPPAAFSLVSPLAQGGRVSLTWPAMKLATVSRSVVAIFHSAPWRVMCMIWNVHPLRSLGGESSQ